MKLFPYQPQTSTYHSLTRDIANFIQNIVLRLTRTPRPSQIIQLALFIFHSHAKITTYHKFDRFIYACAAILLAGKLTEQLEYPVDILKESRKILRQRRGIQGQDSQQKLKMLLKKVFQAEVNLMISIGFDFDLVVAADYLEQWQRAVGDRNFVRQACDILNKLYHTNIVLYYEPQALALTALSMAAKNEGVTPQISGWQKQLINRLRSHEDAIRNISELYYNKINQHD